MDAEHEALARRIGGVRAALLSLLGEEIGRIQLEAAGDGREATQALYLAGDGRLVVDEEVSIDGCGLRLRSASWASEAELEQWCQELGRAVGMIG